MDAFSHWLTMQQFYARQCENQNQEKFKHWNENVIDIEYEIVDEKEIKLLEKTAIDGS